MPSLYDLIEQCRRDIVDTRQIQAKADRDLELLQQRMDELLDQLPRLE